MVALGIIAWLDNRLVLLFLVALCVPLCGLQWNVLFLPVVLHWLVFGGSLRKYLLVAIAFFLSTLATLIAYHVLGMWPSYLQEAARVGGLHAISGALEKLHGIFARHDWNFLSSPNVPYDALPANLVCVCGGLAAFFWHADRQVWKMWIFSFVSYYGTIFSIALFANLNPQYIKLLLLVPAMLVPPMFRNVWRKFPLFLFAFVMVFSYTALVHWRKIQQSPDMVGNVSAFACWVDEAELEKLFADLVENDDVVCCVDSAYCAARTHAREVVPLVFAFDISPQQIRKIKAVVIQDEPYRVFDYAWASFRKSTFAPTLQHLFWNPQPPENVDLWDYTISPDALIAAIANHWHCALAEIPLDQAERSAFIRFRFFRPVFSDGEE